MGNEIELVDLVDIDILRKIQDAFSNVTGMAALTVDVDGKPVTTPTNFTDYCLGCIWDSRIGNIHCEKCNKAGAMKTLLSGESTTYVCHAGLIEYAAPIMANNKLVGCLVGGQVLTKKLTKEEVYETAKRLQIDPEQLWEMSKKIKVLPEETIQKSAQFLYSVANVISEIAYSKYLAIEAGKEMERAGNMKADFLANMSHEIRTPMNAVIGLAEMALREDLPVTARNYITQIRSSGKALLTIINDILDFSKIEAGKMDINVVEYDPLAMVNEIITILLTQLKNKNIDLIIDMDPTLPKRLLGDNIRIKQILINIANNAVKFTQNGYVKVRITYEPMLSVGILLKVSVEDTGIGIKDADKERLFDSFQQLDSKRNRNIEGTGLGLAITKQLLKLMNGTISMESEYEKGSIFSFALPQRTVDAFPCIRVNDTEGKMVICYMSSKAVQDGILKDCTNLGILGNAYTTMEEVEEFGFDYSLYFVVEESLLDEKLESFIELHPEINVLLVVDYADAEDEKFSNITYARKPIYSYVLASWLNGQPLMYEETDDEAFSDFLFTAPDAEILVVDDNSVNLTVTKGLLEPLEMKIDTVTSGKQALDCIAKKHYDLIFMDHMMPDLDGVETTHIIRRMHPEYADVPIIALTANAMDGAKETFLQEGMNDFVPKPIEMADIVDKIRNWLSPEKMIRTKRNTTKQKGSTVKIGDFHTKEAIKLLGSEQLYWTVLEEYYKVIASKSMKIRQFFEQNDWKNYTIEVHALKSASKQVGAMDLAMKAASLEQAGNEENIEFIKLHTDSMLKQYEGYESLLAPYFDRKEENIHKEQIGKKQLLTYLDRLWVASENLDMDEMEEVLTAMKQYDFAPEYRSMFTQLARAIDYVDVDTCDDIIEKWKSVL